MTLRLRPFGAADTDAVIALWLACGPTRPWNHPRLDIVRKSTTQPDLFLVGIIDDTVAATAMVGHDGHRGWVDLAVAAPARRAGHARALMRKAERLLLARGCPKLTPLRRSDTIARGFYQAPEYRANDAIGLGRRLNVDDPQAALW